jgi:pilus assembly protein FimV
VLQVFVLDCPNSELHPCMRNKRLCPASTIVILAAMATATATASAAGFGAAGQAAWLGEPLDFLVQLRLDAGEVVAPGCVDAGVTFGERRLPAAQIRAQIEAHGTDGARIRVRTGPAVDEPVIGVTLGVGCPVRLSRHYVVLAELPQPALAAAAFATAPAFVRAPAGHEWQAVSLLAAAAPPSAAPRDAARAERRSPESPGLQSRAQVPRPQRLVGVATEAPRLRLDLAEPRPGAEAAAVEMALQAVAQAASTAQASAAAASATAARMAALERTVERLGREAATSRDEAAHLRRQLAQADGAGRSMWPLLFAGMLLTALTGWLAWALSSLRRERRQGWLAAPSRPQPDGSGADATPGRPATVPTPFETSELRLAAAASRTQGGASAAPATDAGPAGKLGPATVFHADIATARDVSIEELIDLEQQADFFVVLGQDEAAIDLLTQHLRDTGGGSPLPYLKLLEIHRRRGDRPAYERTRESFNRRFNAYAPAWEVDPGAGRGLEDYPGVLPRLQQVWPRPLDAMAELEALLFRKSRGELFDLPAYREVLFLYALARDRLDRDAVDPHHVDLLLPLADGSAYGSTAPLPLFEPAHDGGAAGPETSDRAETPVDLDLTQAARPTSIFDLLPSTAPRPRA